MSQLHIASIRPHSLGEGPGFRTAVFVSGCSIRCRHCQNPHLFERSAGRPMAVSQALALITAAHDDGVSMLGGEPLDQPEGVAELCAALHAQAIHVVVYTGYVYEQLLTRLEYAPAIRQVLESADVLVDGPYVEALQDERIQFRGSRNQRVVDLVRTRASGTLTLLDWDARISIVLRAGTISLPNCGATQPLLEMLGRPVAEHICGHA